MRKNKIPVIAAGVLCASLGGYLVARAATPLVTPPLPLFYSGFLSQNGIAVVNNPSMDITATLFSSPTSSVALDCKSASPGSVAVSGGHFSVALLGDCTGALTANRTAYVEIKVNGAVLGTRQQVGATPFSYTADTADSANSAVTATNATNATNAVNAMTAANATSATNAMHAANADAVPLAGVTGLQTQLAALQAGPNILGPTTVNTDGTGIDLSVGSGPGGYTNLTTMCKAQYGSSATPCTRDDAVRSLARGVKGTTTMGTTNWVIGGSFDCRGFTDNTNGNFGAGMFFQNVGLNPVIHPVDVPCDDVGGHPVLCCAFP